MMGEFNHFLFLLHLIVGRCGTVRNQNSGQWPGFPTYADYCQCIWKAMCTENGLGMKMDRTWHGLYLFSKVKTPWSFISSKSKLKATEKVTEYKKMKLSFFYIQTQCWRLHVNIKTTKILRHVFPWRSSDETDVHHYSRGKLLTPPKSMKRARGFFHTKAYTIIYTTST